MKVNFDVEKINYFLIDSNENKHVISLDNNSLKFIPLSQTKIHQRIAAWFGVGPLSLHMIAKFISDNREQINQNMKPDISEAFYKKLSAKCLVHNNNYHHVLHRIQKSTLDVFQKYVPMCNDGVFLKDKTYYQKEGEPDGNVDFSYANKKRGFGYVVDGSGHNNPIMQPVLQRILEKFKQSYEKAIDSQKFETVESAQEFLQKTFKELAETLVEDPTPIHTNGLTLESPSYHPAMSFAQIIKIDSSYYLLSVELADTMILIKKADGTLDTSLVARREDLGLGSGKITVQATPISPGDAVIGFSDGIGEFLTLEECKNIILKCSPLALLDAFKEKIISKGEEFTKGNKNAVRRDEEIQTVNQSKCIKYHTFDEKWPSAHDDISLFALVL